VSVLKDLRDQLAADLEVVGVPVFASWPTRITLPCIYVMPPLGSVYIAPGSGFREFLVYTDVAILADHDDVVASLEVVESLLEAVIVNSMDWGFNGVEPPAPITVTESGAEYLGTVLHLSKTITL